MTRDEARQAIRDGLPCVDFLEKSRGNLYECPWCGSGQGVKRTGALQYNEDSNTVFCHSCMGRGERPKDVLDLIAQIYGTDYNGALEIGAGKLGLTIDGKAAPPSLLTAKKATVHSQPPTAPAEYTKYYDECRAKIEMPAAKGYLESRGISLETARKYGVGFDPAADPANAPGGEGRKLYPAPRLIFETTQSHYVGRSVEPDAEYPKMNPKGAKPGVWNAGDLYTPDAVFICEGVFDALSVLECGAPAVALNSANNGGALLQMIDNRKPEAVLILCLDNDPKGIREVEQLKHDLTERGIIWIDGIEETCIGYKDLNEAHTRSVAPFSAAVLKQVERAKEAKHMEPQTEIEQQPEPEKERANANITALDDFQNRIKTRRFEPISTGMGMVDKLLDGGFTAQELVMLGAAPGAGKTTLVQQLFEVMASDVGTDGKSKVPHEVIFFNFEMSRDYLFARSISRTAKAQKIGKYPIEPNKILRYYERTEPEKKIIDQAFDHYRSHVAPNISYNPSNDIPTVTNLENFLNERLRRASTRGKKAPIVVIDYLHLIQGEAGADEKETIKRALKMLKDYAIKGNTVVCAIIALNRTSYKGKNSITMTSGRDTSSIEYSADVMLALNDLSSEASNMDCSAEDGHKKMCLKVTKKRMSSSNYGIAMDFDMGNSIFEPYGNVFRTDQDQSQGADPF